MYCREASQLTFPGWCGRHSPSSSRSAGAPGPGETAGRTSSFPERDPVGPCAAGWIAGPSLSKRHLPITSLAQLFPSADTPLQNLTAFRCIEESDELRYWHWRSAERIAPPGSEL